MEALQPVDSGAALNRNRHGGLTTAEREELSRLRRENGQLKLEREILSKAAAWFARETNTIPLKSRPVHPAAAAIDIGATMHVPAVGSNRDKEPVRTFRTFTADLHRLADWFSEYGIKTVAMEINRDLPLFWPKWSSEETSQRHATYAGSLVFLKRRLLGQRHAVPRIIRAGPKVGPPSASAIACAGVWACAGVIALTTGYGTDFLSEQNAKAVVFFDTL